MPIGLYKYNETFYTGTDTHPDALQIFVKPEKGSKSLIEYNAMPLSNWMGLLPIASIFSGTARIVNAVKTIFRTLSNSSLTKQARNAEVWNAFKNIFRGLAEILPGTGIVLIIFESVRHAIYARNISKELTDKENIAGIAIDGKVIHTIDLSSLNRKLDEKHLEHIKERYLGLLKKASESSVKTGMTELFQRIDNQN